MVVTRNARFFVRIPGVGHLLPTPIPNWFFVKDGILHYNAYGGEEEDPKAAMPKDVEEKEGEPEAEVQPEDNEEGDGLYVKYTVVHRLGYSINDMSDLTDSLRATIEAMTSNFTSWRLPNFISHRNNELLSLGLQNPKLGKVIDTSTSRVTMNLL